jgi:phage-related protein
MLYPNRYNDAVKPLRFLGDWLKSLREFPKDARQNAGYQLEKVQDGKAPDDFKPMPSIGRGVEEIRVWDESGTYRVIYTARLEDAVYVLHAFQKKTQTTSQRDVEIARERWKLLKGGRP